jgi:hypothetical protein
MMAWLQSLENTSWALWLKDSPSIWGYPTLLFLHTIGIAFSAGPSVVIDLRLMGAARRAPLEPFDAFFKVIWLAVGLNVLSGTVLFASDATAKLGNRAFIAKMVLVVAAVALTVAIRRRALRAPAGSVDGVTRLLAVASIVCWFAVITAGRYIAYF